MHIKVGERLLQELAKGNLSIDIQGHQVLIDFDGEQIVYDEEQEELQTEPVGTSSHLEVRLGRGFKAPSVAEQDLQAIRGEIEETATGYYRAVVIGDNSGEVCFALAENLPNTSVYSVGYQQFDYQPDNVKLILKEPIAAAKALDHQAVNALYVLADVPQFKRVMVSWAKHLANKGKVFIIEPEEMLEKQVEFDREAFDCLSDNVYMRTFSVDEDA